MNGNTPEQQKRQDAIAAHATRVVEAAFREAERYADIIERTYFLGTVAGSVLFGGHLHAATTRGLATADEWLREQLRAFSGMLGDGPPRRRVRITLVVEDPP
jgi:hypothetical protein